MGKSAGRANASAERFLGLPAAGVRGQGSVVKSWSSELELESGGLGVRGQYAGVSTQ